MPRGDAQKRKAEKQKEEDDNTLLWLLIDDLNPIIRKFIPSLDHEHGGPAKRDFSGDNIEERLRFSVIKQPAFQQSLIQLYKKKFVIGTRVVFGKPVDVTRMATKLEMRKAIRESVKMLQYIRTETIKECPELGEAAPRKSRVIAQAILAQRRFKALGVGIAMAKPRSAVYEKKRTRTESPVTAQYKVGRKTAMTWAPSKRSKAAFCR
jgi:hypothetical protein